MVQLTMNWLWCLQLRRYFRVSIAAQAVLRVCAVILREHFAGRKKIIRTENHAVSKNVFEEKWKREFAKNVPNKIIKHFQIATNNDVSRLLFHHLPLSESWVVVFVTHFYDPFEYMNNSRILMFFLSILFLFLFSMDLQTMDARCLAH